MKKLLASMIAISTALFMVACGKSGGDSNNTNNGYIPACTSPSVWNGSACVVPNGGTPTSPVTLEDIGPAFSIANQKGSMRITNRSAYSTFLKDAFQICDNTVFGWSAGLAKCDTWAVGSLHLKINIDSSLKPKVMLTAYPEFNWYQYSFQLGIQLMKPSYNPLYLANENTYSLIPDKDGNHSKAFEIRAQGAWGTAAGRYLIQIQAHRGTWADTNINYDLAYKFGDKNVVFATGTLKRTQ